MRETTGRHATPARRHGPALAATAEWFGVRALQVLAILAGCAFVFGTGFTVYDRADQARAETLQRAGTPATVTAVQGHVDHESSKGGGWWEVDGIRVRIDGVAGGDWVELTGLSADLEGAYLDDTRDWVQGWQQLPAGDRFYPPLTGGTGYEPPLAVRYATHPDGEVDAMAEADISAWAGSDQWKLSLLIGVAGLTTLAACALVWWRLESPAGPRA